MCEIFFHVHLVIVCMLHVGLAALTRGTILNHKHVSCVEHTRGVNLTRELYCSSTTLLVSIQKEYGYT